MFVKYNPTYQSISILPTPPSQLLHRSVPNAAQLAALEPVDLALQHSMSVWITLQALGREQFVERLAGAFDACRQWYDIVASLDTVRLLVSLLAPTKWQRIVELFLQIAIHSTEQTTASGYAHSARRSGAEFSGKHRIRNICEIDNHMAPAHFQPPEQQLFDNAITSVVFQFDGHAVQPAVGNDTNTIAANSNDVPATTSSTSTANPPGNPFDEPATTAATTQLLVRRSMERVANAPYFDKLNAWLVQNMQRDCPEIVLQHIEHPVYGTCMRFCPFELLLGQRVADTEQMQAAGVCVESQVEILRATVRQRGTLQRLVAGSRAVLRMVALPDWAGLGGVRYVPDGWEKLLTGDGRVELNRLNVELVEVLRSTDNAFSLGEGADGLMCVRFGMVTDDTDVEELLQLVVTVGARVQENSKVLDTMAEIVKKVSVLGGC